MKSEYAALPKMERPLPALTNDASATYELKATDQMKWANLMNACKNQAEEIVEMELILN